MDCLFCKIAAGDIPAEVVFSDAEVMAFEDITPMAPIHLIVIPRAHYANVSELTAAHPLLAGRLLDVMSQLGDERAPGGYRLVFNTGADAGQSVQHIHGHVLAGRHLGWPPG